MMEIDSQHSNAMVDDPPSVSALYPTASGGSGMPDVGRGSASPASSPTSGGAAGGYHTQQQQRHHKHKRHSLRHMDPHSIKQTPSPTSMTQPMDHHKFMQQAVKLQAQQSGLSLTHPVKSSSNTQHNPHRLRANSEIASWSQQSGSGGIGAGGPPHGAAAMNGLSVSSAQGLASYSHHRTSSHPQAAHPTSHHHHAASNHKMMSSSHNSSSSAHHFRHSRNNSGSQQQQHAHAHARQRRSPSSSSGSGTAATGGEPHHHHHKSSRSKSGSKSGSSAATKLRRYARPRPHTLPDSFGKSGVFGEPNPAATAAAATIDNSRGFVHPNKRNQEVLHRLSVHLTETLAACNKQFRYSKDHNPRRILSSPAEKVLNQNYDNKHSDLVLTVNDVLTPESPQNATNVKYRVIDLLGKGTFGQVVKCEAVPTGGLVAVKVIKNKPAYYNQALIEIKILKKLNRDFDPKNDHNIVRIVSYFIYKKHLCLVFELLNVNLFDLVKQNRYRGLSCNLIRAFIKQVLKTLIVLKKASIIHCDLKPENILLMNLRTPRVKVIDFGSACFEGHTVYQYIQSRFYRSPEVLCGAEYTCQIDMWSLGCIAAELFLGLPLFPGKDEYHQARRIIQMRGEFPSYLLAKGTKTQRLFAVDRSATGDTVFKMKTAQQFCDENDLENTPPKKYFKTHNLRELVMGYQYKADLSEEKKAQEMKTRECFYDFLCGVLNTDPRERWTPAQAYQHPFIRNVDFEGPFDPSKIPLSSLTSPGSSSSHSSSSSSSRERYRRRHRGDRHRSSHHRSGSQQQQQQQATARHHHSSSHHHHRSSRTSSHHHQQLQQQQQQQQQMSQTAPAAPFSPRQRSFSYHESTNQQPNGAAAAGTTGGNASPSLSSSSSVAANAMAIDSVGGGQQPPPAFHTQQPSAASSSAGGSSNLVHRRHAQRAMSSSHTAPRSHQRHQTISPPVSAAQQKAQTLARLQRLSIKRSSPSEADMRAASPTSSSVSSSGRGTPSGNSNASGGNGKQRLVAANGGNPFSDPMPHRSRAFSDDGSGRPPSGGSGRRPSSKGVPMSKASAAALHRQRQMQQANNMSNTLPVFRAKVDGSDDVQMFGVSPPGTPRGMAAGMSLTVPAGGGLGGTAAALSMDLSATPINGGNGGNGMRSPRTSMDGGASGAPPSGVPPKSAVHRKFSSSLASTPETSTLEDTPMDRFSDGAVSYNRLQHTPKSHNAGSGPIQQFGFDIKTTSSSQHLGSLAQSSLSPGQQQHVPPPPFVSLPGVASGIASAAGLGGSGGPASPLSMSRRSSYGMCYAPPPPIGGGSAAAGSFSATSTLGSIGSFDMTSSIGSTGSLSNLFNKPGARSPLEFSPPSRDFHKQSQNFFDLNIAELGGVSTGLTPITHGRFMDGNPTLGTANSAAQGAFYSPQYGQTHHRQHSNNQHQQHPSQHQHRGSFQFYSVTAPAGDLSNHGGGGALSPRAHQHQPPNISVALSPQLAAQQHRMRGQSIGQAPAAYGFDLASLSHAAAAATHGGSGHQRFNSSGSGVGVPMQVSAPGSVMNSPRGAAASPQYPPAFAGGGSGVPSPLPLPLGQQQRPE